MRDEEKEGIFEGKWYEHPLLRSALFAGFLTGGAFILAHLGIIPSIFEIALYVIAIIFGGITGPVKEMKKFRERKIGIYTYRL